MKGIIFDIERSSFVDGDGIRTVVFFKGCNLQCKWCHNPESQCADFERAKFIEKCSHCGKCESVCPSKDNCILCKKCEYICPKNAIKIYGKKVTSSEVLSEILLDKDFYGDTGGVTFSGGECMLQIDFLFELLSLSKENKINTAIDTAGNVPYGYFEKILPLTDTFLYDLKAYNKDKHIWGTGVDNTLIKSNLERLIKNNANVEVRIPFIPDFNGSEMEDMAKYLYKIGVKKVRILPYHDYYLSKLSALKKEVKEKFTLPTKEQTEEVKSLFSSFNITCK